MPANMLHIFSKSLLDFRNLKIYVLHIIRCEFMLGT